MGKSRGERSKVNILLGAGGKEEKGEMNQEGNGRPAGVERGVEQDGCTLAQPLSYIMRGARA